MTKSLPRIRRDLNGARLFFRRLQAQPKLNIPPQKQKTHNGNTFDLYQLRSQPVKTIMPIYGMGLLAENDPRLNKFTQACLEMNTRVVVPHLPGLGSFRLDSGDLEKVIDLLTHIHAEYQGNISVIGFSAGASISLSACASPALADKISSAVVFGPLHDIREVWQTLHSQTVNGYGDKKQLDEALWAQYVIAYRNRDRLGLSENENMTIEKSLRRWSFDLPLETKYAFHQQVIAPLNLAARHDLLMEDDAFDTLSPRGKLKDVQARVSILHDASDSVVPPAHGQRILNELGNTGRHKLLVTPLLSHVTIHAGKNILDALSIMNFLGELYA
jgi:pimeloyl-ACP methyl ester carboxylesterase